MNEEQKARIVELAKAAETARMCAEYATVPELSLLNVCNAAIYSAEAFRIAEASK